MDNHFDNLMKQFDEQLEYLKKDQKTWGSVREQIFQLLSCKAETIVKYKNNEPTAQPVTYKIEEHEK